MERSGEGISSGQPCVPVRRARCRTGRTRFIISLNAQQETPHESPCSPCSPAPPLLALAGAAVCTPAAAQFAEAGGTRSKYRRRQPWQRPTSSASPAWQRTDSFRRQGRRGQRRHTGDGVQVVVHRFVEGATQGRHQGQSPRSGPRLSTGGQQESDDIVKRLVVAVKAATRMQSKAAAGPVGQSCKAAERSASVVARRPGLRGRSRPSAWRAPARRGPVASGRAGLNRALELEDGDAGAQVGPAAHCASPRDAERVEDAVAIPLRASTSKSANDAGGCWACRTTGRRDGHRHAPASTAAGSASGEIGSSRCPADARIVSRSMRPRIAQVLQVSSWAPRRSRSANIASPRQVELDDVDAALHAGEHVGVGDFDP